MITPTKFSKHRKLKRKKVIEYIRNNYPLFRIGKDKMDSHMCLQIESVIKKDGGYFR